MEKSQANDVDLDDGTVPVKRNYTCREEVHLYLFTERQLLFIGITSDLSEEGEEEEVWLNWKCVTGYVRSDFQLNLPRTSLLEVKTHQIEQMCNNDRTGT
ncbi:hypothetical protein C0J52_16949 [Blattella germanica]|nr:hypothetical protein C0J52_16949 [Blattella germanica]